MNKIRPTDCRAIAERLFQMERRGRYEEALAELKGVWSNHDELPDVEGLAPDDAAEIFLRCGALVGFHGQNKLIKDAQETSLNLLTEARQLFADLGNITKLAECESYIALAYARRGNFNEALAWSDESLLHKLPGNSNVVIAAKLTKGLIFITAQRYADAEGYFRPLEKAFRRSGDDYLIGSFCTNLSVALRNNGHHEEGLRYLEDARRHHRRSGHLAYLGTIENNLAFAYANSGRFEDAKLVIDSAITIFRQISDLAREGFACDTKAQVLLAAGEYKEALEAIETAIRILGPSEIASFSVEAYVTKAKILYRLEGSTSAFLSLAEAVHIARHQMGEEQARKIVSEFEASIDLPNESVEVVVPAVEPSPLELVLHPTIAHYRDYHGVWIKNDHFASHGVPKGSLAVVCRDEVRQGDLAAVTELATGDVVCGFYDNEFGIVCLEAPGQEPAIFNETEIEVLGKIVGVGTSGRDSDGKIRIEPLDV